MWTGVFPAVTTKFTEDDRLDHAEMERCFALQMEAGCDGIIVCGSLGEGPMLSLDEKLAVLKTAQGVGQGQARAADRQRGGDTRRREHCEAGRPGRRRRADGRAKPDLSHQPGRDGGDAEGGRRGRRTAGDDLFQPHRLSRRRDGRRSWRSLPAIRCSSRSRNRPTTSAARPRSSTVSATASTCSPASTISPSRRCAVGAIGWVAGLVDRLPARDGCDLPADETGPTRRGARHLPLVPAAARPRRLDLSRPEHQARRSSSPSAPMTACACRASRCRASGARRWRRSSRTRWRRGRNCRSSERSGFRKENQRVRAQLRLRKKSSRCGGPSP